MAVPVPLIRRWAARLTWNPGRPATATCLIGLPEGPGPVTMKVARSALPITLAHWEKVGVRETGMAAATDFVPYWFFGVALTPWPLRGHELPNGV
jgi:hypothetical protein